LKFFLLLPLHLAGISLISSLPLRERTKVRGAVKIFSSSFFPLHFAGEGRVRGVLLNSFLLSSLHLREKTKVRVAVKSLLLPLPAVGKDSLC